MKNGIGEILIIIGSIAAIILAILDMAGIGIGAWGLGWIGWWWGLIWGIIHIIIAIAVLSGMGVLKIPFKLAKQWLVDRVQRPKSWHRCPERQDV